MSDANEIKPKLYYNELCLRSQCLLITLLEKKVEFEASHLDIMDKEEQLQPNFLVNVNKEGTTPVLRQGDATFTDLVVAMKHLDDNFGQPNLFNARLMDREKFNLFKDALIALPLEKLTTALAIFHVKGISDTLYSPFHDQKLFHVREKQRRRERPQKLLTIAEEMERAGRLEVAEALRNRSAQELSELSLVQSLSSVQSMLSAVEDILDEIEQELSRQDRNGPFLCGPIFSAVDILFTATLVRLQQLGLDEQLWLNERRPNICVYTQLVFSRASVIKATRVGDIKKSELSLDNLEEDNLDEFGGASGSDAADAAWIGLGGVLVLAAIYGARKLLFRK